MPAAMPILLPPSLVHPFDLRYVADDVHVIAFFGGHPQYECVEAMLSARADGTFAARAILTRHDQTQIVGERWEYASPQGDRAYEIVSCNAERRLVIASTTGPQETVRVQCDADGLHLHEVVLHSPRERTEGVAIGFAPDGAFAIRVDALASAVSGQARQARGDELTLRPEQPAWAARRPLHVGWRQVGAQLTIDTSRADA
jgi:hypothetical protein